jgi:hypothetical protein
MKATLSIVSSPSAFELAANADCLIENPELVLRPNGSAGEINHSLGNYGCRCHDVECSTSAQMRQIWTKNRKGYGRVAEGEFPLCCPWA